METLRLIAEIVVVCGAIFLGARIGGIGIGFAGGLGVLLLGALGLKTDWSAYIPFDVIGIIMSVIGAIAAMQVAGGLDFLVSWADRMLRKHPKHLTIVAPIIIAASPSATSPASVGERRSTPPVSSNTPIA